MNTHKRLALVTLMSALMLGVTATQGQAVDEAKSYRVVWQVTAPTAEHWKSILGNIENLHESLGASNCEVLVVTHSDGIGMVMKSKSEQSDRIQSLIDSGVRFVACENTMKRKKIDKEMILANVGYVDSGIAEVVRRQTDGWSYINAGE